MNLTEVDSRKILADLGIPVYPAYLVSSIDEAIEVSKKIKSRIVVKVEVGSGSRGKAGGVKLCFPNGVEATAKELFAKKIHGIQVKQCLVAPAVEINREIYLSILLDIFQKIPVVIASKFGGSDIEEITTSHPQAILKTPVSLIDGLSTQEIKNISDFLELPSDLFEPLKKIIEGLVDGFWKYHATLIEINPLAIDDNGKLIAVDAKVKVDDYSIDCLSELKINLTVDSTEIEKRAKEEGLSYVQLDGDVGCIVNGAGLAMATVDAIAEHGMKPANLLDVGGSSSPQKMVNAIELITSSQNIKAILINIFGGITRCTDIAEGLMTAMKKTNSNLKIVVHLSGTASEEAREILKQNNVTCFSSMKLALEHLAEVSK